MPRKTNNRNVTATKDKIVPPTETGLNRHYPDDEPGSSKEKESARARSEDPARYHSQGLSLPGHHGANGKKEKGNQAR